ncbi:DUF4249 domain-containing protein [Algoriphagus sp. NF]|jgi:hypothetical protein|uniref:DUF4249 domain-containing protein n=1 Tax=Algoriphagus sp. NF TaxID=2992756 RepID=UPI0010DF2926|nr:DUF4249 domain-containing protein [Algoriphagus sp. NF]MDE0560718.1 DUF4249 domain-containing protein [Algoriphagus sp. NF]
MEKMLRRFIYLIFLLPVACIDPFEVGLETGEQLLTVEAVFTSQPGRQTVRLTRSDTYGSVFEGLIRPVRSATVIVRDDLGNVVFLEEDQDNRGTYVTTTDFATVPGRSYTLQIQTVEGKVYSSFPEKVQAVPEISNLSVQTTTVPVEGEINPRSGVQLVVDIQDPAAENNFYFWKNGPAVYVLETRPDLFTPRPSDANPSREPQPKDCCFTCYRSEQIDNSGIFIANDDNFNGLSTKIVAGFVEDDGLRFVNTYRVDLRQISISQDAYRFLRLVKQQTEISGSVFDPPPANIRGNLVNLEDPEEVVLGYFIAGAETVRRIYIDKNDLTFQQPKAIIPDDCRLVEGAQEDAPADWNP